MNNTESISHVDKAKIYLETLCNVKPTRSTGSAGNRQATDFFAQIVKSYGYKVETDFFDCTDFTNGKSSLESNGASFEIYPSPFSLGCNLETELRVVSTFEELEDCECSGKILLMKGEICAEQLMPKNFVFYNPDHHKKIYSLLESKKPAAVITATKPKPELVGAIDPFPVIEDGDFDIQSAYCKNEVGEEIAKRRGEQFTLRLNSRRIFSRACNVVARKNPDSDQKIVVCAHIDARASTPGACDNASGTVVLLLLAELLADYQANVGIEIIAFNGEDHYSAAGQMDYLSKYQNEFSRIVLVVNIDDVGYKKGKTAYSFYGCSDGTMQALREAVSKYGGLTEGKPWYNGDHMIFVQSSNESVAFTSESTPLLMQTITHTEKDVPTILDCRKLVELASALKEIVVSVDSRH